MPVITTPEGEIEVLEWGEGEEVWLLLHAAAAGPNSLSGLARALAAPGRRFVAPALAGYGATRVGDRDDRMAMHVGIARAVFDRYPARRRVVFGHSIGGLVAVLAALPADALVVHEPIVVGLLRDEDAGDVAARDWDRAIVADLARAIAAGDAEPGLRGFVEAWNELAWDRLPASVRQRLLAAAPSLLADIQAGSFRTLDPGLVAPPPLILQGSRSPTITARMTARLHAGVPGSRRVVLEGCGHMAPVQAPEAVAAAIRAAGIAD